MVNHRVDASHGEFPGEDRGIRGNSPDPTGTESHSERARQLHWKKIYADHPMLTVGVALVDDHGARPGDARRGLIEAERITLYPFSLFCRPPWFDAVTAILSHRKTGFAPTLPRCTKRRHHRGSGVGPLALSATSAVGVTRPRMRRPVTD